MKKLRKLFGVILIILALVVMQLPVSEASAAATVSDFSIDKDGVLTKYNGSKEAVVIPDGVVTIATDAFKNNNKISSVVIPSSVKKIQAYAFWNCSNLYSVSLGTGLDEIGDFAFANCKNLSTVFVPSNITRIGIYAFQDDISLSDITIPPEVFEIHETAFDGCKKLVIHAIEGTYADKFAKDFYKRQQEFNEYEDVVGFNPDDTDVDSVDKTENEIENEKNETEGNDTVIIDTSKGDQLSSVHVVGNKAVLFMDSSKPTVYYGNQNGNVVDKNDNDGAGAGTGIDENESTEGLGLPKYTIVDGEIVADQAYYCSTAVNYVALPNTIKEIGQFSYARSKVSTIVLPEGLEKISYGAFYHCDDLSYVTIPDTVMKVEPKAFEKSSWVEKFFDGEGESDFLISGGVLVAYRGNIESVEIPDGVRVVAANAFSGHSEITSLVLPESLVSIGEEAFSECTNLNSANFEETNVVSILDRAFTSTNIKTALMPKSLETVGLMAFPNECDISYEGAAPKLTHELTAERLSNYEFRSDSYMSDNTSVIENKGEIGVNVNGPAGVKAYLEGTQDYYYLTVTPMANDAELNIALNRAFEIINDRILNPGFVYDLELTDESGIRISKLGKTALTVAIPMPENLSGKQLTVFTVDRNGQLEEIAPEVVRVSGTDYIRFATYHLSPFAVYETGEVLDASSIMEEETVFSAMAGLRDEPSVKDVFKAWAYAQRWRLLVAGLLVVSGFVLIFARFNSRRV